MANRIGPLVCPVMVGRDELVAHARRRLDQARGGRGHLLLFAGEAGIGKTRLLSVVELSAREQGFAIARGHAHPRDLEVPAAPFLDLARNLARSPDPGRRTIGEDIEARLTAEAAAGKPPGDRRSGDAHRRRRMLSLDLVDMLTGSLTQPTLVALEDLHWADDLSLQVMAALAVRLEEVPLLVVGTYRSDELYPRVPMRAWRARLVAGRLAEEVRLNRLALDQTGRMISLLLAGDLPAPREMVAAVQQRTDGVPLHVEELLGAVAGDPLEQPRAIGTVAVPETLDTAIRDRLAKRSELAIAVARAAAIIRRAFGVELLAAVANLPAPEVEKGIAELEEHFFLVPAEGARHDFRHALIRDAIHAAIPPSLRRLLHSAAADAGLGQLSEAEISRHLEASDRPGEAHQVALSAARAAARMSAHREALGLFQRALRNAPPDLPAAQRGALHEETGIEALATDENEVAVQLLATARDAYREAGMQLAAALVSAPLVAARHLVGASLEERVAELEQARGWLAAEPAGDHATAATAKLDGALAAAYMLDRRLDESIRHGQRALELAGPRDEATTLDLLATLASDYVFAGRMDEGWTLFGEAVERALGAGHEAQAARAYRMAATSASVLVEYERAEYLLREGIAYAERVELWNHHHYMAAHLAHVLWATGRWDEAEVVARHALADGRGGLTTRITALYVLGYLAMGRGESAAAEAPLSEALDLGRQMRELQRFAPPLWGLAELALAKGDHERAARLCDEGLAESGEVGDAAYLFPFLVTATRARLELREPSEAESWLLGAAALLEQRAIPGTLPALDHARGLIARARGHQTVARSALGRAANGWRRRARAWEGIQALIDLASAESRSNRPAAAIDQAAEARRWAAEIGAHPLVERAQGVHGHARARRPTDEPWAPLSVREWQVARLVSEGATNAAIGAELGVSPRTVGAHVAHILNKLGMSRRSEIAAWTTTIAGGKTSPGARMR